MNLLFTSSGRRIELLRAFRRAYADLGVDGNIVVTDIDPLAPTIREADRFHLVPRLSDPGYVEILSKIARTEKIDLVVPLIDPDVPVLARNRERLEQTGARVVVIPEGAVPFAVDKLLTHRLFTEIGVPAPRTWSPTELPPADVEFPLFIKPRFGSAGQDCVTVRNPRELEFFLQRVPDPIVQEHLPGAEITTDVFCDLEGGGKVLAAVSRRRIEVRQGEVAKGVTVLERSIIDHCVSIAHRLEAIGPITIQCILREGAPQFTEINARFGGGVPLGIAAGVPSPHWLLALACGKHLEIPPLGTYEIGLYLTRFDDSFFVTSEQRMRLGAHLTDGLSA